MTTKLKLALKLLIPTFTRAEDAGNVTLISKSKDKGGNKRSPFLTAPFTKTVRAFGLDKILQPQKQKPQLTKDIEATEKIS